MQCMSLERKHGLLRFTRIKFKLYTSAEVTAISLVTYEGLKPGKHAKLEQPSKIIHGPGNEALNVVGQFDVTLTHKGLHSHQTIFVVKGLKTNLLGSYQHYTH